MGPLHNIWVGMTAVGINYFMRCTDLTSLPCFQTRGLTDTPDTGDFLPTSLPGQCKQAGIGGHSWRLNPTSPLLSHLHGLCSVHWAGHPKSPLCPVWAAWNRIILILIHTHCAGQLSSHSLSFTGCIFKQLLLPKLSFKQCFFPVKLISPDKHELSFKAVYLDGF